MESENTEAARKVQYSKVIPVWKFILLSVVTFDIYLYVWIYRQWDFIKTENKPRLNPLYRTVLFPLFVFSFTINLKNILKKKNRTCRFPAILLATLYFTLLVISTLSEPFELFVLFLCLPMLPVLYCMNRYYLNEEKGALPLKKFTWWQIVLMFLGLIFLFVAINGILFPEF